MARITPEEARGYRDRWNSVNALEVELLRRTSMEDKLRQLASLVASRSLFPQDTRREEEVAEVRERWTALRQVLGA